MNLQVEKIADQLSLDAAFAIREKVFVNEQNVNRVDERDAFDQVSSHFLARWEGNPVGTARWRVTTAGIKLERFAVLIESRGKGIGQALVKAVLDDIKTNSDLTDKTKYLNAQLSAVPLYLKFGFVKVGDVFEECNILHYKMELI